MIVVHHLNNSRSQRILWLLEELGLDYKIERYERNPETMLAPASLREVHPLGKSPVITDDSLTLAESGAIIEYIIDRYGNGKLAPPRDTAAWWQYIYWLHYAEGSAMSWLLMKLILERFELGDCSASSQLIAPQVKTHFDYMESELSKSTWFVGDEFTAADIAMSFPLELAEALSGLDASYPQLKSFFDRIHARPAYKKALERGGKYELLF